MKKYSLGFVLGKFCPLHKGHMFLIDKALETCEKVYVVVDNIMDEVISVKKRIEWVRAQYPQIEVFTQLRPLPQDPSETPDFWNIWRTTLLSILPHKPDAVFASEHYGQRLAKELSADFVEVDIERRNIPISATQIRNDLCKNWNYLSDAVKSDFQVSICIYGPESTGKSTLTKQLAEYFDACYVEEYAKEVIENNKGDIRYEDMEKIISGHHSKICLAAASLTPIFFVDTDAITSEIWSEELFGKKTDNISYYIQNQNFTHYLLLDVDIDWQDDIHRFRPDNRVEFFNICRQRLELYHRPYTIISGKGNIRLQNAINVVNKLLPFNKIITN